MFAQGQPAAQDSAGVMTPWEIAPVLDEIGAHAGRLKTVLDQVDVKAWVAKGASETYLSQWRSSAVQAQALADGAKVLARNPERLSPGLELFFRMRAVDTMVGSLAAGMRKYQKPADGDQLAALVAEIAPDEERYERYLVGLAAGMEQQLAVMDKEAQRCRVTMSAPAYSSDRNGKKK